MFFKPRCIADTGSLCPSSQKPVQAGLALSAALVECLLLSPRTAENYLLVSLTSSFPLWACLPQGTSPSLSPRWYRGVGCGPPPLTGWVAPALRGDTLPLAVLLGSDACTRTAWPKPLCLFSMAEEIRFPKQHKLMLHCGGRP